MKRERGKNLNSREELRGPLHSDGRSISIMGFSRSALSQGGPYHFSRDAITAGSSPLEGPAKVGKRMKAAKEEVAGFTCMRVAALQNRGE